LERQVYARAWGFQGRGGKVRDGSLVLGGIRGGALVASDRRLCPGVVGVA
jgi:hypothetical protein